MCKCFTVNLNASHNIFNCNTLLQDTIWNMSNSLNASDEPNLKLSPAEIQINKLITTRCSGVGSFLLLPLNLGMKSKVVVTFCSIRT